MNRHFLATGLTVIATATTVTVTAPAQAYNLSDHTKYMVQDVSQLSGKKLNQYNAWFSYMAKNVGTDYDSWYAYVEGQYSSQAKDYALEFDDWLAMNSFVNNERAAYGTGGAKLEELTPLDLANLTWKAGAHDVEVFFINEGAGYWNKFGYSTESTAEFFATNADISGDEPLRAFWNSEVTTIWNGIASTNSILANGGSMTLGEGYMIGDVAAGDTVNFFLRNPQNNVFDNGTLETTFNKDRLQHVTTYQYEDFLVLAYEDLYNGGDKDYNDVVIAVKGLTDTARDTAAVPEPGSVLALVGLGIVGTVVRRQRSI